jgi:hypothetical protein
MPTGVGSGNALLSAKLVREEGSHVAHSNKVGGGPLHGADVDSAQHDTACGFLVRVEGLAAQLPKQAGFAGSAVADDHDLVHVELAPCGTQETLLVG